MSKRIVQRVFFAIGLILFAYLVKQLGAAELWRSIQLIGWWWLAIIVLAVCWIASHTWAWREVLAFFGHRLPLWELFKLKMIADAINMVVPSANLGGDTLRAHLIRDWVPGTDGIPSVLIDKTLDYISKMLFNIAGFAIALFFIDIPAMWFWGCLIYLVFIFIFYALLVLAQLKGLSGGLLWVTQFIPPLRKALEKRKAQLQLLDTNLHAAYTKGRKPIVLAACWHMLGRLLGLVEIWLLLWLLGAPVGFAAVFFVSAVVNVVNGVFFIVPGQWGVAEGAQVMLVQLLGFPAAIGLSLGVIRRLRRLLFAGVGLMMYYFYEKEG